VVVAGLRRLVLLFVAVAAASALLGLLVGAATGSSLGRAVSVGLDLGGALLLVLGFFAGTRGPLRLGREGRVAPLPGASRIGWLDPDERGERLNLSALLIVVGLLVVVLGLVSDARVRLV